MHDLGILVGADLKRGLKHDLVKQFSETGTLCHIARAQGWEVTPSIYLQVHWTTFVENLNVVLMK